ncbi:hypothetical protein SK128_025464 [Halocaridina rubra]|uniref:Uncharacterized protein n=1 Tax=Halocaridina rubra TaxID=373956 RepID=A0AAN8X5S2_HALRR
MPTCAGKDSKKRGSPKTSAKVHPIQSRSSGSSLKNTRESQNAPGEGEPGGAAEGEAAPSRRWRIRPAPPMPKPQPRIIRPKPRGNPRTKRPEGYLTGSL